MDKDETKTGLVRLKRQTNVPRTGTQQKKRQLGKK